MKQFIGKHRGTVVDTEDPLGQGRIRASVPSVTGSGESSWAMPSSPFAGKSVGFWAIPPEGARVWIEYEQGDPDYPIWSGCFWGDDDEPPADAEVVVFKTKSCTLTLDDRHGGAVTIETAQGMKLVVGPDTIEIDNGRDATIHVSGNSVSVNGQALVVT